MQGLALWIAASKLPPKPKAPTSKHPTLRALAKVMTPAVLDALAPTHRWGRYGAQCSDADPCRGLDFDTGEFGKDWRCLRCILIEAMAADPWDDTDADIELYVGF